MSNDSPPIEHQYFARTQTPESPRPVHLPEPTKIPVLLNQMDPSSNDLATYNIPTDQTFAHYGDSLENPAYKSSPSKDENDPFQTFLRNADSAVQVADQTQPNPTPTVPETANADAYLQNANHIAVMSAIDQVAQLQRAYSAGPVSVGDRARPSDNSTYAAPNSFENTLPAGGQDQKQENGDRTTETTTQTSTSQAAEAKPDAGVDYQSLLDTITQSASTAPAATSLTAPATEAASSDFPTSSLPAFPGLPPKPPPLDTQPAFPSSINTAQAQQSASSLLGETAAPANTTNGYQAATNQLQSSNYAPENGIASSISTNPFEGGITNEQAIAMHMQYSHQAAQLPSSSPIDRPATEPSDRPWSPKTQAIYDRFLEDERHYVTEGIWDRFPLGSRLFVGNLPSEKVTKRDLFHRFHQYGKLAQISIKQAYGFVQYHEAQSCRDALDAEQGVEIRGRKVHLEISKPQKGSKGAQQPPKVQPQPQIRRRSRSPQRRTYSDYRDEPARRKDEYRSRRSPSPRGYRRDSTRDDRRSPMYGSSYSTPQPSMDDEMSLPYPRRDPRYVPDVQVIVLDAGVNQAFVNWIEDGFRRKNLSCASTWLNQRTPLQAVVKRQIMEGVQAVVKVSSLHQSKSKVPLQVFNRNGGATNVTWDEYGDLDVPIAADIVSQARQRERGGMQAARPQYPPPLIPPQNPYQTQAPSTPWTSQPQNMPQFPPHPPPPIQQYQYPPQPPQQQYRPPQPPYPPTPGASSTASNPPDLHQLLANLKGGTAPPTPQSAHSAGQPYTPYGQPVPQNLYYGQPQYQQQGPPPPPQPGPGQQNVQNIMDQLARFQRQ